MKSAICFGQKFSLTNSLASIFSLNREGLGKLKNVIYWPHWLIHLNFKLKPCVIRISVLRQEQDNAKIKRKVIITGIIESLSLPC